MNSGYHKQMDRILFITNRDVLTTCGALRLIKNRAEVLYSEYQIATDFCVFQKRNRVSSPKREKINAGGEMWIVGYSIITLIFSYFKFVRLIQRSLRTNDYKAIVISQTALPLKISSIKNNSNAPIYLDGHGASEDIYESARGGSNISLMLRYLAYKLDISLIKYYLKYVDGSFVVSNGMKEYYDILSSHRKIHYVAAPCSTVSIDNHFDYNTIRREYRKKFGVSEVDLCFVYSGGIEPWQCVKETIDLFKKIASQISEPCKMFIFTYEIEKVNHMVSGDDRFYVTSFKAEELRKALCAMNYAFLIRQDSITNHVAFPNKYLEYIQARLKVITTPYVYDVAAQIELFDCGFIYENNINEQSLAKFVVENAHTTLSEEKSIAIIKKSSFKNCLKTFVDSLKFSS